MLVLICSTGYTTKIGHFLIDSAFLTNTDDKSKLTICLLNSRQIQIQHPIQLLNALRVKFVEPQKICLALDTYKFKSVEAFYRSKI